MGKRGNGERGRGKGKTARRRVQAFRVQFVQCESYHVEQSILFALFTPSPFLFSSSSCLLSVADSAPPGRGAGEVESTAQQPAAQQHGKRKFSC